MWHPLRLCTRPFLVDVRDSGLDTAPQKQRQTFESHCNTGTGLPVINKHTVKHTGTAFKKDQNCISRSPQCRKCTLIRFTVGMNRRMIVYWFDPKTIDDSAVQYRQ